MTMQLEVHMSPWQYADGYAERIGALLGEGSYIGCAGKWRVRRWLAAVDTVRGGHVFTVEVRRVTFELEPLNGVARNLLRLNAQREARR